MKIPFTRGNPSLAKSANSLPIGAKCRISSLSPNGKIDRTMIPFLALTTLIGAVQKSRHAILTIFYPSPLVTLAMTSSPYMLRYAQ